MKKNYNIKLYLPKLISKKSKHSCLTSEKDSCYRSIIGNSIVINSKKGILENISSDSYNNNYKKGKYITLIIKMK